METQPTPPIEASPRPAPFAIDHVAFPCFDVATTARFYTELLGGVLCHAQTGPAEAWSAEA